MAGLGRRQRPCSRDRRGNRIQKEKAGARRKTRVVEEVIAAAAAAAAVPVRGGHWPNTVVLVYSLPDSSILL